MRKLAYLFFRNLVGKQCPFVLTAANFCDSVVGIYLYLIIISPRNAALSIQS